MNHFSIKCGFAGLLILLFLSSCKSEMSNNQNEKRDPIAYNLGVVAGFSELINAGVKQLALSSPMTPEEMDRFIEEAKKTAANHQVSVYRESDLIITELFPADIAKGKDVLLLYQGTTLDEYLTLKADQKKMGEEGSRAISRRFGRMLSYSPRKINQLLSDNTSFRTMYDFGIRAHNLFLYYKDLQKAGEFYTKTLGLELIADYQMAKILRVTADSYLILVDATKGMHTAEEPKTVALALLTDQLEEWYDYLKDQKVKIKYEFKSKAGSAHDGFVAIDPEGYLLEFERFNQHPENERFVPILAQNKSLSIEQASDKTVPEGLNFHSTITWLYYKDVLAMENYFQNVLGLQLVADQGWTKIYQVSQTGFLAIVDERRGMHQSTEKKAVNVGFILDDLTGWFDYVSQNKVMPLHEEELGIGPETRYKAFVGYCPEGYYLEFDRFFPHSDNEKLLQYLKSFDKAPSD